MKKNYLSKIFSNKNSVELESCRKNTIKTFITPLPNHWTPDDFDLSSVEVDASLLHITQTICLLESRCDDYAAYLQAIFRDREAPWTAAIHRWNFEECQHGETLRKLCESSDLDFNFDDSMSQYQCLVSYHAPTGESVRGSVAAEMVSRCVVEALASTLYRVLADAARDENVRAVYTTLAQDEARHYGMFLKMLEAEASCDPAIGFLARCSFALKRIMELEDAQIMIASCVIAGRASDTIQERREANWYMAKLCHLYRWNHLQYTVRMLLRVVGLPVSRGLTWHATLLMWSAMKMRSLLSKTAVLVCSP